MEQEGKKIMGFIDPKWLPAIGIGAGLAVIGAGAYYFFGKSDSSSRRTKNGRGGEGLLENNSIITNLANSLLHETQQYSKQTLEEIMMILEENACEDYCLATLRSRKERRPLRESDFEGYCRVIQQELDDQDAIITDVLSAILTKIGGNLETYQNSVAYWAERDEKFGMMQLTQAERWKLNLKEMTQDKQSPSMEQIKQMYTFEIQTYPRIQIFADDPEFTLIVKKAILHDLTFEKFGFEEEARLINGIGTNQEVAQLAGKLQQTIQIEYQRMILMLAQQRHTGMGRNMH